jgi:hypothetical protein
LVDRTTPFLRIPCLPRFSVREIEAVKLKLDLHPIYSDSQRIEQALQNIIAEAVEKRASEVEIIPGKGSGALKKSVLRFLDRPEIKMQYHRIDKDSDNWGRLFVYFRHEREASQEKSRPAPTGTMVTVACACCTEPMAVPEPEEDATAVSLECAWCGSPNRVTFRRDPRGALHLTAKLDYGPS